MSGESLCLSRLNGGGRSRGATALWGVGGESRGNSSPARFPDPQGKYREILPNLMLLVEPELSFPSVSEAVATDSLRSRAGKKFRRAGNSWEFEAGSEPRHSSEFILSLACVDGKDRQIYGAPPVRQLADFVSDSDRLTFGALRGAPADRERNRVALRHGGPAPAGDQGCGLAPEGPSTAFDLLAMSEARWRRVIGAHFIPLVRAGVQFGDDIQAKRRSTA